MLRTLTPLALALAVSTSLTILGCGGDNGTEPPVVTTVVVTPGTAQVQASATAQYTATALDAAGTPIAGVTFTWSSADMAVATVDANGLATGQVMGTTEIRATASGITGSGTIVVVPNSNADPPDDAFTDSNGDGIDGDIAKAVFVAVTGADANPGSPAQPKATLAGAITAAVADPAKSEIYVSAGTYSESVQLADGISIYGGYSQAANWDRSAANVVTIDGDTAAVIGLNITQQTVIDLVTVQSADNTVAGGNSTGIYLADSDPVILRNLTVTAGTGGSGVAGTAGADGALGSGGMGGLLPIGGVGGPSPVGNDGGDGGAGSVGAPLGDMGLPGLGPNPGAGGMGGADGLICPGSGFNGTSGAPGGGGAAGMAGAGGNGVGSVVNGFWTGGAGVAGTAGSDGSGGGGGGGGGVGPLCGPPPGAGGGGGGGGGGGAAGQLGAGGSGGGGSFGLFAFNSNVQVESSTITAGVGGAGGDGGPGGAGGIGGSGGGGSAGAPDGAGGVGGVGGNGGAGGDGGSGGPGGGGGGGVSYAAYAAGTSTVQVDGASTLTAGTGGAGGAAAMGGNAGTPGASGDKNF